MDRRQMLTRCLPGVMMGSLATGMSSHRAEARTAASAPALPAPAGPVVLTVSGRIRRGSRAGAADFDMAGLARLPQTTLRTSTPWHPGVHAFTGPLLRELLALVQAEGSTLRALALNDYRVDIPVDDLRRWDVVLARLLDDQPMPVRDKGPLFVMYPLDAHAELRNTVYYSRCAWQLRTLEVL